MPENPEELIPLTPRMFLISNKNTNIEDIEELDSNSLNKRIKYRRRDGKIRTVRLKTQHGNILRPIQRIYPLEICSNKSPQRGLEESIPTVSETLSPDEFSRLLWRRCTAGAPSIPCSRSMHQLLLLVDIHI
ncbi:DUF5641 domain-containing protein [Trichonephila clavipes]|nr:DUF5641 domain-containing protein [Trichonephila clavipes]